MSSGFKSDNDYSFNLDELLQIGAMCRELRKENNMLRESQSRSTELIKRLELDVKLLSEARTKDTEYIQELENDLRSCSQEIGYLQDQLNLRNIEANCLGEHVHSLELKLAEVGKLHHEVSQLKEELVKSRSDRFSLIRELENKEVDLQNSILCIRKLEEAISYITLESECEIESVKLDLTALEQLSLEAKKIQVEAAHEKIRMDELIEKFEVQFQDSQKMIRCLEEENNELKEKLGISERNARTFYQKVEEHFGEWLENHAIFDIRSCQSELPVSKETGISEEVMGPLLSKLTLVAASDENIKDENEKLSHQILKYELLVKQLKDELREEKLKAKEEAEDLTQEMAELRYQITGMLEEECKRRACIEQASVQRIAELETQLGKEQKKSSIAFGQYHEAQKLAESRSMEVHHLKKVLREGICIDPRNEACSCGDCITLRNITIDCINKGPVEAEAANVAFSDDDRLPQAAIAWRQEETW